MNLDNYNKYGEAKIGAHVSLKKPNYLVGSVYQTINYCGNAMMFYTGAPQNTIRQPIEKFKIKEFKKICKEHKIEIKNVIVHAPYIINPANCIDQNKQEFTIKFLLNEITRTTEIGAKYIILHPGNHLKEGVQAGLDQCIKTLNQVLKSDQNIVICLETMAGKGTEIGFKFEQLAYIINKVKQKNKIAVCLDTCHINDAGYDIKNNTNQVISEFDKIIGLQNLKVVHLNDSKNPLGGKKDRHENIGYGHIGFQALCNVYHHKSLAHVPFILETPYYNKKAPYFQEIMMLKNKKYVENWREIL